MPGPFASAAVRQRRSRVRNKYRRLDSKDCKIDSDGSRSRRSDSSCMQNYQTGGSRVTRTGPHELAVSGLGPTPRPGLLQPPRAATACGSTGRPRAGFVGPGRWRGVVVSRVTEHSHVVRYDRRSALGAVVADSLLDSMMPLRTARGGGGRCSALCPSPRPGLARTVTAFRPGRAGELAREERKL